jgi:hypothetical protein
MGTEAKPGDHSNSREGFDDTRLVERDLLLLVGSVLGVTLM